MLATMADAKLSILALSAYHGGVREAFLEGLAAYSRHEFAQLTLPPRTWPRRLKGSALWFADEIGRLRRPKLDLILADDLTDTSRLRALLPAALRGTPIVQYFHDDVLSADLRARPRDEPLAVSQLHSILTADLVLAASEHHRQAIVAGAKRLVRTFPDAVPAGLVETVEATVAVCPPGVDAKAIQSAEPRARPDGPPVVLWNHPWTDEQNPAMFFETLAHLEAEGIDFRLIAVGIAVRKYPEVFQEARRRLARHIVQFGYVPGREQYLANIRAADVVVSTARQEWFPLTVVEAVIAGAAPLVSRALANAEVFGDQLAGHSYRGPVDLRRTLARLLTEQRRRPPTGDMGRDLARRYGWPAVTEKLDRLFTKTASSGSQTAPPPKRR